MFQVLLVIFAITVFNGCWWCEPKVVFKTKEVKVPVKCKNPKVEWEKDDIGLKKYVKSVVE